MRKAIKFNVPRVRQAMSVEADMSEALANTWKKLGPAPNVNYDAVKSRRKSDRIVITKGLQ